MEPGDIKIQGVAYFKERCPINDVVRHLASQLNQTKLVEPKILPVEVKKGLNVGKKVDNDSCSSQSADRTMFSSHSIG